jgi:hypothetical protein
VAFTEDQHTVGDLGPGCEDEPFGVGVRARTLGRDLHGLDAGAGQDCVEGVGELPSAVADQEPEVRGAVAEVHREVADLLGGPRPVRVRGDPEDVDVARADFDDEQAVKALERYHAVHVEEVGGEHGRCLGVQELPPRGVSAPFWCWRNLQDLEVTADRGWADPVADFEQFALDPPVPPAVVLSGEPLDQRGDLGADRRPSRAVRVGPFVSRQLTVPPQDGAGA